MLTEANYLIYEVLKNGNLKISLTPEGQELITERTENGYDVNLWSELTEDTYVNGGYAMTDATDVGGLTDSPMIINYKDHDDDGNVVVNDDNVIWWYPEYQIKDEFAELLDKGFIIFTLAE